MNESFFRKIAYKSKLIGNVLGYINNSFQFRLLYFYKEPAVIDMIKSIKNEVDFAFFPLEAFVVYSIAKSQSKLEGEMVEVGVFQGGSAKLICEAKGDRKLHLFDTFEGLPELSDKDTHFGVKYWQKSQFGNTSVENVKRYLSKYPDVYCYKGTFPETASPVTGSKFSFVHLDVDLYQSTMDCLKFFFPRLVQSGIILSHDYHTSGVRSAFNEFFKEKKTPIVELPGPQCMVINNSSNF